MPPAPSPAPAPPSISSQEKLAFGLGGAQQNFGNLPKIIVSPVYNILLGVNPALIGAVLLANRLCEALWEPLIGLHADERSGSGRSLKPLVILGSVLLGGTLPLIFLASAGWSSSLKIAYLLLATTVYCFGLSLFTICTNSLVVNRTSDGSSRNQLAAWFTGGAMIAGFANNWMLPYVLRDMSVANSQWRLIICTGGIALLVALSTYGIYRWTRESLTSSSANAEQSGAQKKAKPRQSYTEVISVLKYRPYLSLLLVNVAAIFGSSVIAQFGFYVKGYYMFSGDVQRGAFWTAIAGSSFQIVALACMPVFRWAADRFGKLRTMQFITALGIAGEIIKWFVHKPGVDPLWLPFVAAILAPYGALSMLVLSMLGDVSDSDAAIHGVRRSGTMIGVMSLCTKAGLVLAPVLSGLLLHWSGFDATLGTDQPHRALISMRIFYSAVPLGCTLIAFVMLLTFPVKQIMPAPSASNAS